MPEFRREIGGANLGNIPGVRAVKPHDSGAATAKIADTLLKTGLQVGGRAAAQKAGRSIAGQEETAAGVDKALTQASNELEMDVLMGGDQGQDLSAAQLEDIKKSKFDEVLGTQKRLKSALSRGLISSTEANARINMLRNEALANPLVAMFQGELDNQLFPSGAGGTKGGAKDGIFGATQAEKEAAGAAKGRVEAAEQKSKEVSLIEGAGFTKPAAEALWQRGRIAEEKAKALKAQADAFNYNKKDYTANSKFVAHETNVQAYSIFSEAVKSGGSPEAVNNAIAKMEALKLQAEGVLTQGMRNKEGVVVGDGADFETANGSITKSVNHFSKLLKEDFAKAKVLAKQLEEKVNGTAIQTHDTLQALYGGNKVFAALMNSGNQELSKLGIEIVSEIDGTKNRLKGVSNKLFGRVIEGLSSEELGANVAEAVKDVSLGGDEGKTDEEKEESLNYFSVVAVTKSGPALAAASYGQGRDEEVDDKFFNSPIAIDQIGNSRWWSSYARTDPNALRALDQMIEGAAARSQTVQFSTHKKKQVTKRSRKGGLSSRSTETVSTGGIPQTVVVTPIAKGKRGRGGVSYSINSGGVVLTDEYKKNITSAYKLGVAHEGLWNKDFDNVNQWINSMFAEGELPEVEEGAEGAEGEVVKKEPLSLISNAGASELDPSEVDAGFPKEEENVDISGGLFKGTAVHDLQKEIGVDEDGIVGPDTKRMARAKLGKEEGDRLIKEAEAAQVEQFEEITDDLSTRVAEKLGRHIEPEWVQAIWMHESDKGNKVLGGTYNLGNIKAKKGEASVTKKVWEVIDGKDVMVDAKFRKFDNFEEASEAWADFLDTPRYAKAREAVTFKEFTSELKKAGYATDPEWEKGVHANVKENSRDSESAKGLIGDLDKIEKERAVLKLMAKFKNLTFQEMVDEGIIDTTLEQELF